MDIHYIQITVKLKLKQNLIQPQYGKKLGEMINSIFSDGKQWTNFHKSYSKKGYTFSPLVNETQKGTVFQSKAGDYGSFYIFTDSIELANRIESHLFGNHIFDVLDVVVDPITYSGPISSFQIKNPILLVDKKEDKKKIYVLAKEHTEQEKIDYIYYLNKWIREDFEYNTKETLPQNYKFIQDIKNPRIAHYETMDTKLVGTKGTFAIDQSIVGKLVAQYVITHGIGMKSSYLGAGSVNIRRYD